MKTSLKVVLIIVVVLVAVRLALPYIAKTYINKTLANLEEYEGHVYDVDISLIRGAYVIDSVLVKKKNSTIDKPFFTADKIDISLEWKSLFKGAIVGEFVFTKPQINFVSSEDENKQQTGGDEDWVEPLKSLMPIKINNLKIVDGSLFLYDYDSKNRSNIYLKDLNANFANMSNVIAANQLLPSSFVVSATSIGNGKLNVKGKADFLKQVPNIDYNFVFEDVNMPALNDFLRSSANIDAERGNFNLYHELAINDSVVDGYIKPIIKDLKIFKWKEEGRGTWGFIKEGGIDLTAQLFKNHKKDQFATKLPVRGPITDPKFKGFIAFTSTLQNTFIKALKKETDDSVSFSDVKK